jgi:hypothetical protein
MDAFGDVLARVIAETIILVEGTLAHFVDFAYVDGNITNISLSPSGQSFCANLSNLLVSFSGALNSIMTTLWTLQTS